MDDEFYVKILTEIFNEMRSIMGRNWELQFDNDLKHKSKLLSKFSWRQLMSVMSQSGGRN